MKQIDLGGSSFAELREKDKYYVDKTLLIRDILESNDMGVYLFARPRRFGKTMNLSMLDAFFNIEYKGNKWFDGLEITKYPECMEYMSRFPVIHLNLIDTKAETYESYINKMRDAVKDAFEPHRYLLERPDLDPAVRDDFEHLDKRDIQEDFLSTSIKNLSAEITKAKGAKPVILIDEYDAAVSDAFGTESHERMLSFLGRFMCASIKWNLYRGMVCITGVTQIAKQSIPEDMNNVVVNNVFSRRSDERFGFTESEVKAILSDFGYADRFDIAKEWYGGYRFGDAEIYNPYSIMHFVSEKCEEGQHWIENGRDVFLGYLLKNITSEKYTEIMKLVAGDTILSDIWEAFPYESLEGSGRRLYCLMVMSGYLKAVKTDEKDIFGNALFRLSVPNEEVGRLVGDLMESVNPADANDSILSDAKAGRI